MAMFNRAAYFALRAVPLLLGLTFASAAHAEPRTIGISIPYENFFKSVYPIIGEVNPGESMGQTFFATGTGTISEFEFASNGDDWGVSIYEGRGNSGPLLHSQIGKCALQKCLVKFSKPVPVTGGKNYTVVLKNNLRDMYGLYVTMGNAYKSGDRVIFRSGYRAGEGDLYFQVRGDLTGQFVPDVPMEILTARPEVKNLSLKPGDSVGQSFVAPGTGTFEKLYLDTEGKFDVAFYAGEGTSGKKIDAQTLTFANSLASLARAVPVEEGKQYTFVVTNRNSAARTVGMTKGDGYPYGVKLLNFELATIVNDISFRLLGWTKKVVTLPEPPLTPAVAPYQHANGPLTLMNCEPSSISVSTFNEKDALMAVPFRKYTIASGAASRLECKTTSCKLKIGNLKTGPVSGYFVMIRGNGKTTHPAAMAAGCKLYSKYK